LVYIYLWITSISAFTGTSAIETAIWAVGPERAWLIAFVAEKAGRTQTNSLKKYQKTISNFLLFSNLFLAFTKLFIASAISTTLLARECTILTIEA
jgi:Mg2+/Co2+ transporter CorB